MAFPYSLTNAVNGVTEIDAGHLNNLEGYVGIVNSTDPDSLSYKLTNANQVDPGHKHTHAALDASMGIDGDILHKASGAWGPRSSDAAGLVDKSTNQTVAGVKTFSEIPVLPASDPTTDNQAARKAYVDAQRDTRVAKAGDTMSGPLVLPGDPTADLQAATKQYVDNGLAAKLDISTYQDPNSLDPGHKHSKLYASDGSPAAVTVDGNDKIGFLTDSPQCQMHLLVSGTAGTPSIEGVQKAIFQSTGGDGYQCHIGVISGKSAKAGITFGDTDDADIGKVYYDHNNELMAFTVNAVDQVIIDANGNVGLGTTNFGANAAKVLGLKNGMAPTTSPSDMFQMWSADQAAGNACPHFRTENGAVLKLYQQANINDPSGGSTVDAEARAAINSILDLLENLGLMAA
ncbi:MAG: hypothetical protein JRI59_08235 [Deltaproteobacteria bacterium]|nr:hypothetical protein [Deltaproteobacteria bacterium]MBW1992086.1 hypothetical protein [Deltaproteobacteria bacterium]